MQNGLPFHLGHLTSHPELAGKPLPAVDPGGRLFSAFGKQQVVPGVVYIAAERTAAAEVTSRGLPKNIRFVFGAVHDSSGPHACRSEALEAVVAELSRVGINACIVCIFLLWSHLYIALRNRTSEVLMRYMKCCIVVRGVMREVCFRWMCTV